MIAKTGIANSLNYLKSLPRETVISLLLLFGCLALIAWNGQRLDELRLERPQATTPVSSIDPRANIDSSVGKPSFSVPKAIFDPLANPDWQLQTAPIESIKVGMRVPALNPQLSDAERTADIQVDPKTWRKFTLEVDKEDGSGELLVTLLRPASWLVEERQMTDLRLLAALAEQETQAAAETSWLEQGLDVIDAVTAFDPLTDVQDAALDYGGSIWSAAQVISPNPLELLARVTAQEIQARAIEIAAETLTDEMAVEAVLGGEGAGSEIFLEMPELGAVGFARVVAIEHCPEVLDGPGRVVTATFRHQSANVLDLAFAPVSGPKSETTTVAFNTSSFSRPSASSFLLGVTSVHPFWSVDRADFVPAGELRHLEQVLGIDGQHFRLTSIIPRAGPETVYNFEVALDHVYYVGEGGLLVHNACSWLTKKIGRGKDAFKKYWDKATAGQIKHAIKKNKRVFNSKLRNLNGKGGYHEWFMVKHADKMKEWGLTSKQLVQMTQEIKQLNKVAKGWKHGGKNSGKVHNQISKMIEESKNFGQFKEKLRKWAEKNMKNGIDDLPEIFRK